MGAYALLLTFRRQPVPPGDPAELTTLPELPDPQRLEGRRSYVLASHEADAPTFPPELQTLSVTVRDLPAPWRSSAGVGVYDQLGMRWDWVPLAATSDAVGPLRVQAKGPVDAPLTVVLGPDELRGRHGYWARADLAADRPADAEVRFDAPVQRVLVHTGPSERHLTGALRLRREGDPEWTPIAAVDGPLGTDGNGDLELLLGPGTYLLETWASGEFHPVRITVPGPREVTATFGP